MAKDGKIFAVQLKGGTAVRLVKARGPISARAFVAEGMIEVRPASADEVYRLAQSGVQLETAADEAETRAGAPAGPPDGYAPVRHGRSN